MWDNNTPLQLLKTMPRKLNQENLSKIQMIIDADKYKNSLVSGFDLCGIYAPFCRGCDKTSIYPCAIAYIRMLQAEGMKIQIDASPLGGVEIETYQAPVSVPKSEPVPLPRPEPVHVPLPKPEPVVIEQRPVRPKVKVDRRPYESKYRPAVVVEPVSEIAVTKHEPPKPEPVLSVPVIEEPVYKAPAKIDPPVVEKIVVEEKPVETNIVVEAPVEYPPVVEIKEEEPPVVIEPVVQQYETPAKPDKKKIRIAVARRKL
ncbi:MAG: hypothetical protein K2K60_01560 [Clostridia bacterium]|nr:hypothetical protein [Clostridia bacterium]